MGNYSYETSYEPYLENQANNKQKQCDLVLSIIKTGYDNLLAISEVSGIPQAIISARCNDLITEGKIKYSENEFCFYKNRKRKKIVLVKPIPNGEQINIF